MSLLWVKAVSGERPYTCVTEHLLKGQDPFDRNAPRRIKRTRHATFEEALAEGERRSREEGDTYPNISEAGATVPRGKSYYRAVWDESGNNKPGIIYGPKIED